MEEAKANLLGPLDLSLSEWVCGTSGPGSRKFIPVHPQGPESQAPERPASNFQLEYV